MEGTAENLSWRHQGCFHFPSTLTAQGGSRVQTLQLVFWDHPGASGPWPTLTPTVPRCPPSCLPELQLSCLGGPRITHPGASLACAWPSCPTKAATAWCSGNLHPNPWPVPAPAPAILPGWTQHSTLHDSLACAWSSHSAKAALAWYTPLPGPHLFSSS